MMDESGAGAAVRVDWLWFLGWAIASSIWCVTAASQLSAVFDEPHYIVRGLEAWRTGSHGGLMQLGTMPLPIDVATFPLFIAERWRGAPFVPSADLTQLLPWARAAMLFFWWLLLFYAWRAGRALAGAWAGRLSVALLACEPTMLAHASLATTDIAGSACLLALVYHFRMGRALGWPRRVGVPTLWYAATVLAKTAGLVYGPLCLLAAEVSRALSAGDGVEFKARLALLNPFRRDLQQILGYGLLLVFLYCGSDWRTEPAFVAWAHGLSPGPLGSIMLWLAEHLRIFSNAGEPLAREIKHNLRGPGGHWTYLLGEVRRSFWYYFPLALSIKLSLPLLALPVVIGALRPRLLVNWANLAAAALLLLSLVLRVQIGVRLVLPLIGLAVVGLAASAVQLCGEWPLGWSRRLSIAALSLAVVSTAAAAVRVWPDGLCYTNALWGGTPRGYLYLSDSNYDWGQGLKELARWQRQRGVPLDVWYFGTDPLLDTLPMRKMPLHVLPLNSRSDVRAQLHGHYLAAGITLLYGVEMTDAQRQAVTYLREHRPVARTTTFFIYDFTHDRDGTGR
jgi:hypothetical protein